MRRDAKGAVRSGWQSESPTELELLGTVLKAGCEEGGPARR